MTNSRTDEPNPRKPLRLWPGLVIAGLVFLVWFIVPILVPGNQAGMTGALGGAVGGLLVMLWWLFFSRARWLERLLAVALTALALVATPKILHVSVAKGGMGLLFLFYALPVLGMAFVAWAVVTRRLSDTTRLVTMVATILLVCAGFALVRSDGTMGTGTQFAWRWSQTAEERLLAQGGDEPPAAPAPFRSSVTEEPPEAAKTESAADPKDVGKSLPEPAESAVPREPVVMTADWPGFRGADRDGVAHGARIATDWSASPPVELWSRPIGPGWSSFAVDGNRLYTQEQRGEEEIVACYDATTGEPVWWHRDEARFWESQGGPGPRGTPSLAGGRLYAFGATGILNALDAKSGAVLWSRNVAADTDVEVPYWGFSSSPLVIGERVIVAAAGKLAAYDLSSGKPSWHGPAGGDGYSSPHLATIGGVAQVVQMGSVGAVSVAPADGTVLWEHEWKGYPIVQPALTEEGDLLISANESVGLRRIAVARGSGQWTVEERWTSTGLKPYFNDFVVHEGHAYGFDGGRLASINLEDGARVWKGGRYGQGQLVLLPDQDLLLVLSEKGELALVSAAPDKFNELARFPAIEGKTWNHPVLVDDLLLVRNDQEMAAFRLPASG